MTPIVTCAAVMLWSCAVTASGPVVTPGVQVADVSDGPSLSEITRAIETQGFQSTGTLSELIGSWMLDGSVEGRGKKPKPMKMAMAMAGAAAGGMMMMKAMGAIKMFMIHSFLATKLGLIIGLYLLLCKMMEMKQTPPKKVVKWVPAPPHFEEHQPAMAMMHGGGGGGGDVGGPYPASQSSYMEQHMEQQQQQPADQYGPPPQQQYMPSGDFGGGGDMQAHYSHVSPVTYRPVINRGQSDGKSGQTGRIQ